MHCLRGLEAACAECLVALSPATGSQLASVQEADRKWSLTAPDMRGRVAQARPIAMFHPHAAHQQQRIALLIQVHVPERQRWEGIAGHRIGVPLQQKCWADASEVDAGEDKDRWSDVRTASNHFDGAMNCQGKARGQR